MELSPQHEQDLLRLPDEKKWQLVLKDVSGVPSIKK
jgi:hypothetical protein